MSASPALAVASPAVSPSPASMSVVRGKVPGFADVIAEHRGLIRRTLLRFGVRPGDLADVQQEVMRGIHRGLPRFDPALSHNPGGALRGWIFAICERQAARHRRAGARRKELLVCNDELDASAGRESSPEDGLLVEERKALLSRLLETLPPDRRAVIVAHELERVAMADVALMLRIPVNTAWNRLRLARRQIRAALGREDLDRA